MRGLARLILFFWGIGSAFAFATVLWWIGHDPDARALRDATVSEIVATTDRMLAEIATPERMAERIAVRLDEQPRNWMALDALMDAATQNGTFLPIALHDRFSTLRDEDHGLLVTVESCAICVIDATSCSLTQVFVCQAPVNLTPVGDVIGVTRAASDYLLGNEIDQVDLALSIVGLAATAAALPSGGSSAVIKGGAGLLKTALKMGRVSRPLISVFERAIREGVIWDKMHQVRSLDGLMDALRIERFTEVSRIASAMGDVYGKTDLTTALHLLPLVDNADDAERLARSAKALGPRLVGKVEILGKARLFRATVRLTKLAGFLAASFLALAAALSSVVGIVIDTLLRSNLRKVVR